MNPTLDVVILAISLGAVCVVVCPLIIQAMHQIRRLPSYRQQVMGWAVLYAGSYAPIILLAGHV